MGETVETEATRFRFAELADADQLGIVHTRSWQAGYAGLLDADALAAIDPVERAAQFRAALEPANQREHRRTWVVAMINDEIVGHVISHCDDGQWWLGALYLTPDAWGKRIGDQLHHMAMRGVHRFGGSTARLHVLKGNDRAIRFYEDRGWQLTGVEANDEWSGFEVTHQEMQIELSVDVLNQNRDYWDQKAPAYAAHQTWSDDVDWGIHAIGDEAAGNIFPDVNGRDVLEIGCGTGYVSWWAMQRGARVNVGLDNSPAQLATATERAAEKGVTLPLVWGDGHHLPFADNSFDVAINEYGAAIWCDPHIWIPEAARVLRPGGLIWFLGNSVQFMLCAPEFEQQLAEPKMLRPQRGMHRMEWIDTPNVEFHVSHGEMISILTAAGFVVEALHELYSTAETPQGFYGLADGAWASQWPIEEVWVARKPPVVSDDLET